jgi:hypothetical protein
MKCVCGRVMQFHADRDAERFQCPAMADSWDGHELRYTARWPVARIAFHIRKAFDEQLRGGENDGNH